MKTHKEGDFALSTQESAKQKMVSGIGQRLIEVRGPAPQKEFAKLLDVHTNTYARWERNEAECSAVALVRLFQLGFNPTWILTGNGEQRLIETAPQSRSQSVRYEVLTVAIQLAEESLDGRVLPTEKRAELVGLIYEMLEEGLPNAKVLRFARAAIK